MTAPRSSPVRTAAFTLAEILVSILIFSIVSLAMVTILLTSTNLFRAGEHARASTDEAVAALGALDEDLKRLLSEREGGFFFCGLHSWDQAAHAKLPFNGDCRICFTINSANQALVDRSGRSSRQLVMYWVEKVDKDLPTEDDVLYRAVSPIAADAGMTSDLDVLLRETEPSAVAEQPIGGRFAPPEVVAHRCLHFGAWISGELERRRSANDWTQDKDGDPIPPDPSPTGKDYSSLPMTPGAQPNPFPAAIRFTLTLSAGHRATASSGYGSGGYVVSDNGSDTIRVTGLGAVPTVVGAAVRIDDEWIQYTDYVGGALKIDTARGGLRGARRSTPATHDARARVLIGQTYALARAFPH
jgi:type II secretory pathway component PulJ